MCVAPHSLHCSLILHIADSGRKDLRKDFSGAISPGVQAPKKALYMILEICYNPCMNQTPLQAQAILDHAAGRAPELARWATHQRLIMFRDDQLRARYAAKAARLSARAARYDSKTTTEAGGIKRAYFLLLSVETRAKADAAAARAAAHEAKADTLDARAALAAL